MRSVIFDLSQVSTSSLISHRAEPPNSPPQGADLDLYHSINAHRWFGRSRVLAICVLHYDDRRSGPIWPFRSWTRGGRAGAGKAWASRLRLVAPSAPGGGADGQMGGWSRAGSPGPDPRPERPGARPVPGLVVRPSVKSLVG